MSASNSAKQAKARDLKHRVLTCLHKLSDRDTQSAAASELETIAKNLPADALPPFISSVSATDSSDKSLVRRQCLKLVSILSEHHGNLISPYLSKVLSGVVRRLRDSDSSVRAACVAASLSLSSHVTSPPFTSFSKPFVESLFTEQDLNAQTGAALCLAAVIEGSRNPDAGSLKRLLPRIEKLAKCKTFKAKPALLALVGSVVEVEGVLRGGGKNAIRNLLSCLVEFLSSEDWAARKAAAEALMRIAAVEKESLSEFKASCLKTFKAKRFDKVKAARETMTQMIEAWVEIPDLPEEFSRVSEPESPSKENASDGCFPTSISVGSNTRRRSSVDNLDDNTLVADGSPAMKRSPSGTNIKKPGPAMFQKLDQKKPSGLKVEVEIVTPAGCYDEDKDEHVLETIAFEKSGIKRALFKENSGKQPSRVVVANETDQRECEDLSLIREQLLQIESQQSNLLDMLQKFIGSSQKGLHSLEERVHGLELDLAASTRRMSENGAAGAMCCKLPGSDFLSSKLWRKPGPCSSTSRLPASGGNPSVPGNGEGFRFSMENRRFLQDRHALVMNPLAKIPQTEL